MTVVQNDILSVTAKLSYIGSDIQNVYHVLYDGVVAVSDAVFDAAAALWLDDTYLNIVSHIAADVDFDEIEIRNITQDSPSRTVGWPNRTAGGDPTTALPLQAAALVSFPTDKARVTGRKYIGGLTEAGQLSGGDLESAVISSLVNYAVDVLAGFVIGAANVNPVVYNQVTGTVANMISSTIDDIMRTQRRRVKDTGS